MAIATLDLSTRDVGVISGAAGAYPRITNHSGATIPRLLQIALWAMVVANLGRIPLLDTGQKEAPLLLNDLFIVTLVSAGLMLVTSSRTIVLDRTARLALTFAAVGGLSALLAVPRFGLSMFELAFSMAYLLRWCAYFGIYLIVLNFIERQAVWSIWRALEGAILLFAGFGIFQAIFLPGFAQMIYPSAELFADWDPQGHRLVSTFLDPNYAGMFVLMGLLVLAARLSAGDPVAPWKLLLLFAALVLTVSRSSALALVAGGLVILWVRGLSKRLVRFGAVLLACLIPLAPLIIDFARDYGKFSINASALSRVVSWVRALEIFGDHPLIGVGFNTYGFVQQAYGFNATGNSSFGLDGGILFIAVMTGLIGVVVYGTMLTSAVRRCRVVWTSARPASERGFAIGVAACTVAITVHSLFLNSLLYPFLMEALWVMWGLVQVMSRAELESSREGPVIGHFGLAALGPAN